MASRRKPSRRRWSLTTAALPALFFSCVVALAARSTVQAEIDNQLFTSSTQRIRLTVPKGWRASELPSYPGILLWMLRSQPEGRIVVGSEPLRHELFCSWPPECRTLPQPLAARYACALRAQLDRQNILLGPVQAGPKENAAAGLQSVWFEFTDGKRFVRQALAANERRVISLSLSTGSAADRGTHARAFDQALRSLRELTQIEAEAVADASPPVGANPPAAADAAGTTPSAPGASAPSATPTPSTNPPAPSPASPSGAPSPAPAAGSGSGSGSATGTTPATPTTTLLDLPLFDPSLPCPGATAAPPAPATPAAAPPAPAAAHAAPSAPATATAAPPAPAAAHAAPSAPAAPATH